MWWGALILVAIAAYLVSAYMRGMPSFWKLAAQDPEWFYQYFKEQKDHWIVAEPGIPPAVIAHVIKKSGAVGPFHLYVPSLSGTIRVYGIGDFEREQQRVVAERTHKT